jgi:hypothetical protein
MLEALASGWRSSIRKKARSFSDLAPNRGLF